MSMMEETIATCTNLDTLLWWQSHFEGLLLKVQARIAEMDRERSERLASAQAEGGG